MRKAGKTSIASQQDAGQSRIFKPPEMAAHPSIPAAYENSHDFVREQHPRPRQADGAAIAVKSSVANGSDLP
jgi:hypothetical protein